VVESVDQKKEIFQQAHQDLGHKGRDATYKRVANLYWWDNMYTDIRDWQAACLRCAKASD